MSEFKLYDYTDSYRNIANLIEENPELATEDMLEALANIQESSHDKITNTAELIVKLQDNIDIISKRQAELKSAKSSLTNKVDNIKRYLLENMQNMDMKKVSKGTRTVSIRNNAPKLLVKNKDKVPEEFKTYNTVLNVDSNKLPDEWKKHMNKEDSAVVIKNRELAKAIKQMEESEYEEYATLEPNPSVTIK